MVLKVLYSGSIASLLRQDSTRSFQKLLRIFLNTFATPGTEPADVFRNNWYQVRLMFEEFETSLY